MALCWVNTRERSGQAGGLSCGDELENSGKCLCTESFFFQKRALQARTRLISPRPHFQHPDLSFPNIIRYSDSDTAVWPRCITLVCKPRPQVNTVV